MSSDSVTSSTEPDVGALAYQPALDGLRAVAVGLVLLFHLGLGWMSGGYLGVSVFFTLSGFLITGVLLRDVDGTGTVRMGRFYQRRLRRLAPASLLTLVAVVVLTSLGVFAASAELRNEIAASALQSLNLYEIFSGASYAELFREPSPVAHFWSLGVEEQFYWVWPVVFVGCLVAVGRRTDRLLLPVAALFLLASASAVWTAAVSPTVAYYAPWSRAAEILAGALLAVWIVRHGVSDWWRHLALPALLLIVVVSVVTPAGQGWAYEGGLPVFALVTMALIAGLQASPRRGAAATVRRVLTTRPFVAVGVISYGIYLVHWPVFLVIDGDRVRWPSAVVDVVRVAVTVGIAAVMYRVVERPIRFPVVSTPARPVAVAAGTATVAVVVLAVLAIPGAAPPPDAALVIGAGASVATPSSTAPGATTSTTPPTTVAGAGAPRTGRSAEGAAAVVTSVVARPTVVGIFGDSVPAWMLRDGAPWFDRTDVTIVNVSQEACDGMVGLPLGRDRHGKELEPPAECRPWTEWYPDAIGRSGLDLDTALLVLGQAPTVDRLVDGVWRHPCEGIDWYLDDLTARIEWLQDRGVDVVVALPAPPGKRATYVLPDDAAERVSCIRTELEGAVGRWGVRAIDLGAVLCPDGDCDRLRSGDGTHVDPAKASDVLNWVIDRSLATT